MASLDDNDFAPIKVIEAELNALALAVKNHHLSTYIVISDRRGNLITNSMAPKGSLLVKLMDQAVETVGLKTSDRPKYDAKGQDSDGNIKLVSTEKDGLRPLRPDEIPDGSVDDIMGEPNPFIKLLAGLLQASLPDPLTKAHDLDRLRRLLAEAGIPLPRPENTVIYTEEVDSDGNLTGFRGSDGEYIPLGDSTPIDQNSGKDTN